MANNTAISREVSVLARYIVGHSPTPAHVHLYERASRRIVKDSAKTMQTALKYPFLLPYLDAHDAFFRPNSELRQRLYLMFSILEASPDFADSFLPRKHSTWYIITIGAYGLRGIYRLIVGTVLVKVQGL